MNHTQCLELTKDSVMNNICKTIALLLAGGVGIVLLGVVVGLMIRMNGG